MPKTKLFIEKARAVHGDRYDYSRAVYVRAKDKLIISCGKHGAFLQMADTHTRGGGCKACGDELRAGRLAKIAGDSFVDKAVLVHGDRYDYSKVKYTRAIDKVKLVCTQHGEFETTPNNHLAGSGCLFCAKENALSRIREDSAVSFIERATFTHGGKYDYSKSDYINSRTKVVICCADHGDFEQVPHHHIDGRGCPRCPNNYDKPTSLYLLSGGDKVKIGVSLDVKRRVKTLNSKQPFIAKLVGEWTLIDYPHALSVEKEIHGMLSGSSAGLTGFDGASEWFNITPYEAARVISEVIG